VPEGDKHRKNASGHRERVGVLGERVLFGPRRKADDERTDRWFCRGKKYCCLKTRGKTVCPELTKRPREGTYKGGRSGEKGKEERVISNGLAIRGAFWT